MMCYGLLLFLYGNNDVYEFQGFFVTKNCNQLISVSTHTQFVAESYGFSFYAIVILHKLQSHVLFFGI